MALAENANYIGALEQDELPNDEKKQRFKL